MIVRQRRSYNEKLQITQSVWIWEVLTSRFRIEKIIAINEDEDDLEDVCFKHFFSCANGCEKLIHEKISMLQHCEV